MKSTHTQRLERWLGVEQVTNISEKMRGFYAPIPLANAGGVIAMPDGDFVGVEPGGAESCLQDKLHEVVRRERRKQRARMAHATRQLGGFSSVGDLISEMTTGGKAQFLNLAKTGVTGVAAIANNLWEVGAWPPAGTITAATEFRPDNTTDGGLKQANAAGGDTLHFISASIVGTVANNSLLMYDLFSYYCHNIATQSPSGLFGTAPTRYQDTTSVGAFITAFVTTALGGTVGTYQMTYVDQDGNTAETNTAQSLVSASIARRFPFAASVGNGWFLPLNTADKGVRKFTAITQSVATGTGNLQVCTCKPLVWIPIQIANVPMIIGGVTSALNLSRIVDGACLAFMEVNKGATTATSYSGQIVLASG